MRLGLDLQADFPVFQRHFASGPLVYLDSAATSQKPKAVINTLADFYSFYNANTHRGLYQLAEEATEKYEQARETVAEFLNAPGSGTVFGANATALLNQLAASLVSALSEGDEIVLSVMEHHSNLLPWQHYTKLKGLKLHYLSTDSQGNLDLDHLEELVSTDKVKLVSLCHVSNVLGTINPIKEIASLTRDKGIGLIVDGAQAVPQIPVDFSALGCDYYVWTGHKALGPTGIGVLHAKPEKLEVLDPFLLGGGMVNEVESFTWRDTPWKFEAGTPPIAEAVGLESAVSYLTKLDREKLREHELNLVKESLILLKSLGAKVYGSSEVKNRGGVISFNLPGLHAHDVAEICARYNVCLRAGHHCAQPLMKELEIPAALRISFGPYSYLEELEVLEKALREAQKIFS